MFNNLNAVFPVLTNEDVRETNREYFERNTVGDSDKLAELVNSSGNLVIMRNGTIIEKNIFFRDYTKSPQGYVMRKSDVTIDSFDRAPIWRIDNSISHDGKIYRNRQTARQAGLLFVGSCLITKTSYQGQLLPYDAENDMGYEEVTDDHPWLVGFEIEKEDRRLKRDIDMFSLVSEAQTIAVSDGSLCDGYELVTKPMNLTKENGDLDEWLTKPVIKKYVNGMSSSSCGGHIHLSKKGLSSKELVKELDYAIPLLLYLYRHRSASTYCRFKPWDLSYSGLGDPKYQAVLDHENRIELRFIPEVKNLTQLKWRINLLRILLSTKWCEDNSIVKALGDKESPLCDHLLKIYTPEGIKKISGEFNLFYNFWNNGILSPILSKKYRMKFSVDMVGDGADGGIMQERDAESEPSSSDTSMSCSCHNCGRSFSYYESQIDDDGDVQCACGTFIRV